VREQAEQATAGNGRFGTRNPVSLMRAEAEVVAAAAPIAFIVTFVTAYVLDRWWRS
jgi:hypothetical protein